MSLPLVAVGVFGLLLVVAVTVLLTSDFTQSRRHTYTDSRHEEPRCYGWSTENQAESECPICLEQVYRRPNTTLKCGHRLHTRCYQQYQAQDNRCPICRRRL